MTTVFTKKKTAEKYTVEKLDIWKYKTTCMIGNYQSEYYKPKIFDTLEEAKQYGESFFDYLYFNGDF